MSLIAKLWGVKRGIKHIGAEVEAFAPASTASSSCNDRNSNFGADRVRILLFRECEWRGRKLLFDSLAVNRNNRRCSNGDNNNETPSYCRNVATSNRRDNDNPDTVPCEHGKLICEDISQLSEMIYGTVAMTYKGPSFKIHAMNPMGSLMCTKVFPYSEHSICRQSERHSNETLGASTNCDSNSSNSSLRTQHSRPGSGNLSGNSLSPSLRKNSTCSSTGSGWDIDIPRLGSSHSLDGSSGVGSSGGSLSSLRRRWMRVVSTSLSRSESDDAFGQNYDGSTIDSSEVHLRRHKTRLGLAMLLQLPAGQEKEISNRLLEHAALLEGMLDRLRHSFIEAKGAERSLVARLYRTSSCCTLRLLRLLMTSEAEHQQQSTPLLWHDLLLNSIQPANLQLSTVYRSLQQMCSLLEELDTKSTNFFLSTIVTAVLTHHLGWVHTAPPNRNRQLIEEYGQQYPCNPLWAQLNDLYGALGMPARIARTVIAGNPKKANLIDAILSFLSYFLRSGLVEKRQEIRCTEQEDVAEAITILERTMRNNPSLDQPILSNPASISGKRSAKSTTKKNSKKLEVTNAETIYPLTKSKSYEEPRKGLNKLDVGLTNGDSSSPKIRSDFDESMKYEDQSSLKKLKRSSTLQKNLNEYALSSSASELQVSTQADERQVKSKVKIIVSDESEESERTFSRNDNALLRALEKTPGVGEVNQKLALLRQQKINGFDLDPKTLEEETMLLRYGFVNNMSQEVKSQVYFTLGGEEKPNSNVSIRERLKSGRKCQCSYTFTRVPSTSADLPEGVLRKIIQRNFPESSKNMRPPDGSENDFGVCFKCRRGYAGSSQGFVNGKLLLETPTNATEVLRGCGGSSSSSSARVLGSNSMEALIEASCVIELPMPRSKKVPPILKRKLNERIGFARSLLGSKTVDVNEHSFNSSAESGYTWGMVVQGFTKRKKKGRRKVIEQTLKDSKLIDVEKTKFQKEEEWWWPIREGLGVDVRFPLVDQPISEALCIVADLDNWQVGLISNTAGFAPVPVGMSRLVSNMLEAFTFMWKEFRSPEQCIKLLESRLREVWLRSETLAEYLLSADLDDANVNNLTNFLDVDAADLPLLLAVATTHTPQIAQRFGLTLA